MQPDIQGYAGREMKTGEIMFYNWNRIAFLDSKKNKTPQEKQEIELRISFRDSYVKVKLKKYAEEIARTIEKTISLEVIESVDMFINSFKTKK